MKSKIILLLLILFVFTWGCGNKTEDPNPADSNNDEIFTSQIFNEENLINGVSFVAVPTAMTSSGDQCALQTSIIINSANIIQAYSVFLIPALTNQKSSDPIEPFSGHNNYSVYEWSDGTGEVISIQQSENNNERGFKVFIKDAANSTYDKLIESQEEKDGTNGTMIIYEEPELGQTLGDVSLSFTWNIESSGVRHLVMEEPEKGDEGIRMEVTNNSDLSWHYENL